jgi:PIN domain
VLVTPLPGADRVRVVESIRDVATGAINLRGSSSNDPYRDYIRWANDSALKLSRLISAVDVDRLVLTRRYWALQSATQTPTSHMQMLLNAELDERVRELEEVERSLHQQIERWSREGQFVVPDTSFYIRYPTKLEEAVEDNDLFRHLDIPPFLSLHFLVPILVVDELDGLKQSGNKDVRWRAGYTLAVLDNRLKDPTCPGIVRAADPIGSGGSDGFREAVSIEILFDPPGHTRLPVHDDEIIDRALAAQVMAGRDLTLVTFDTGQSMRARAAGLTAVKLDVERDHAPVAL